MKNKINKTTTKIFANIFFKNKNKIKIKIKTRTEQNPRLKA